MLAFEVVSIRLIMTLLVRDEIDVVRQNIEFHLRHGVDFVVATDNGSTDGTREALADLAASGIVRLIDEPGRDHSQHRWVSRMAALARDEHGGDWILNCDADEFWCPLSGNLKTQLANAGANMIECRWRNMFFAVDRQPAPAWFGEIIHRVSRPEHFPALNDWMRDPLPAPFVYLDLPSKVVCRAAGLLNVDQGNHSASYGNATREASSSIVIYHFPVRSFDQFVRKVTRSGSAYARNMELPPTCGWHARRWYRMLSAGDPDAAFRDALPSADRLEQDLQRGEVIVDRTIADTFCA
jgi:hypothetical protein